MIQTTEHKKWSAKGLIFFGFITLAVLVGGIGSWAVFARLAGAIVASGLIEVESNRQKIGRASCRERV